MSLSSNRLMTTGGDTSDGRCEDHDMSPRSDRLMTTDGDTSDRRCEFRPSYDNERRHLRRRCEGHDRSPVQNAPEPM